MRKHFLLLALLAVAFTSAGSNWIGISSQAPAPGEIRVVSSSIDRTVVHVSLGGFTFREVQTPDGAAVTVGVGKATPILEAGAPDLPKMAISLVIPDQAGMSVRVVSSSSRDFRDIRVAPSKGVILRDQDPAAVPYRYGSWYSTDKFYPGDLAGTRDPYIIRDIRGQTLLVYPFQYNPVSKVLRVFYDLTLEFYKTSETGINPLPVNTADKMVPKDFVSVYLHHFANLSALTYTPLEEYGNLLVICYGPFMSAMQPYVNWKTAEGYPTEMISSDSAGGTADSIRAFIANYYATKGLTHVLLVGDAPQIPTNTGGGLGGPSDNAYGYIAGNDHYADVFVGRFSAETEADVVTQVQRTLDYEQNPQFPAGGWYTTVTGIASDQGPGDDNEMDYEHIRNQQTKLLAYTYTSNPELFDGFQGGNDAPGNPTPADVTAAVDSGAGLILYTGHGSKTSWGTTGFSNSNVNQLSNAGKLPFIWSVACVNGNFVSGSPCFAEAWLRATKNGQPTGAVAFLGSTINQSWDSPMEGQDAMTDILVESDSNNIKRTFAGLSINGCMDMIDVYGTDGANMADTWTIFGDPTIMVRTSVPQPMTVSYNPYLFVGDSVLRVYCDVNKARVTATRGDSILSTTLVTNDSAYLAFPPLTAVGDTIRLTVTAYNRLPYQGMLVVSDIPTQVVAGFTAYPTRVIPGDTANFADTSSGTITVRHWSFPGGTPAFSGDKNPVVRYNAKGYYDVQLIVGNAWYTDTLVQTAYITVDFPENTREEDGSLTCSVKPNPANGIFSLDLNTRGKETFGLAVYDPAGNLIYREKAIPCNGHLTKPLDLSAFPDGVYLLQIRGNTGMLSRKLVIRK